MWDTIKSFFGVNTKVIDVAVEKAQNSLNSLPEFIVEVKVRSFYASEKKSQLKDRKVVSVKFNIHNDKIRYFSSPEPLKVFNMFLEKNNFKMLNEMVENNSKFSEEHMLLVMKKMQTFDLLSQNPLIYDVMFKSDEDKEFGFIYLKYLLEVIKNKLDGIRLTYFSGAEWRENSERSSVKMLSPAQDEALFELVTLWSNFLCVVSQISPVLLDHLEELEVLDKLLQEYKKLVNQIEQRVGSVASITSVNKIIVDKTSTLIEDCLEMALMLKKLNTEDLANVARVESNVKDFSVVLEKYKIVSFPSDLLSEKCNNLLVSIQKNLKNVSEEYLSSDLSFEVPKMFNDVLDGMFKSYFAMPTNFRTTMYNNAGKTVQDMLENVLETINNRLIEIAISSHQGNLHDVSVINQFTKDKWQTE